MKTQRIALLVAGAVSVLALSLAAAFVSAGSAATTTRAGPTGSTTFTDPTGDVQGTAPDVTTFVVTDDYNTGTITFTLTAPGYVASTAAYTQFRVYMNTDLNPSTGSANQLGADYALGLGKDASGSGWWIDRWDGSKYADVPQSATMNFVRSGDVMTWTVNKSDIAVSNGMSFWLWSAAWDANDNQIGEDEAPDDGVWLYTLSQPAKTVTTSATTVTPVIGTAVLTPARVTAGMRLTVSFPVTQRETGQPLMTGTMICDPSVSGKVISHSESFKSGTARLSFVVPKAAKGKTLKVKLTIRTTTGTATRISSFTVH